MLTLLFCKQKPLLKNAYATFLQAKTFTKKMLTLLFCKQKPLPKKYDEKINAVSPVRQKKNKSA